MAPNIDIFRRQLEQLCEKENKCQDAFGKYLQQDNWTAGDFELLLRATGQTLLDPSLTLVIGSSLRPWILEFLGRAQFAATKSRQTGGSNDLHVALCIALSKLLPVSNDVQRFALQYFQKCPPPYAKVYNPHEPNPKKRKKLNYSFTNLNIIRATYDLLCCMGEDLGHVWKWNDLIKFAEDMMEDVRWLACNCIAVLSKMSEVEREKFILGRVTKEMHKKLSIENGLIKLPTLLPLLDAEESIEEMPSSRHIAIVGGVSLPLFRKNVSSGHLVIVASTERNLEGVALAVSQGHPVLIEGVVGSGKTSVVEHLAAVTGRNKPPFVTKVQLGDQTDSKTLLGTYCCTQNPGEFVWRPGSLTQAVTKGYWLLLEDLDYAPMDVISILVPLLESRTLPVPGYGNVRAHPGFQLFATRRTLGGSKMVSGCTRLLDKLWTKVTLETLSRSELEHLISQKWPGLNSIADRLTATYLMLSAGQHDDDMVMEVATDTSIPDMAAVKMSGRLVSTRDLMKWCSRVNAHINTSEMTLATKAFQEALDCFCSAVPVLNTRYTFALHVGSFMNCARAEVEYYCTKYKPEITDKLASVVIGQRGILPKKVVSTLTAGKKQSFTFSFTRPASLILERIAVAINNHEPVLLVGETGTGKTSTVQYLAHQTKRKLRVINMNQQSDSTDLLGGFKPVEMKTIVNPLLQEFEELFVSTFSAAKNKKFLGYIKKLYLNRKWTDLFFLMVPMIEKAFEKLNDKSDDGIVLEEQEAVNTESRDLTMRWKKIRIQICNIKEQVEQTQSALAFAFIEGALVKAVQEGEWVLLDEINLASAETLECLSGLLESNSGSLILLERGDNKPIKRHSEFRLFACMNPATDVGKKELPAGIRNRFTELFMDELEDNLDIMILINDYLEKLGPSSKQIQGIKDFYKKVKRKAASTLTDGQGRKPHFSLRTLCRALSVAARNPCMNLRRSLYEAFCLSFLTQLDRTSHPAVVSLILTHVMDTITSEEDVKKKKLALERIPAPTSGKYTEIEGYWVPQGSLEPDSTQNYIITETVKKNLQDLVRIVSIGRFPVLLQGETSVGKTSLITYLARLTGNRCVRINNHEHTDLQEYVGSYAPNESGKLVFKEGILVKAMRSGYWIILDELNLAPTDVLEALNRLLDDNRELFIPETQETIKAHKHFMLFATQNPPGLYGGRKVLSRAFRNRFVELHFDEIPPSELETILHMRCEVPLSYSKKMISVLQELQRMRRGTNIFQGKHSFITLRDLFRWAERYRLAPKQEEQFYDWDQHLADEGYIVLAGRVRAEEECELIRKVIEKRMKKKVLKENLFSLTKDTSPVTRSFLEQMSTIKEFEHVVWTQDMRRLYILVAKALFFGEPVLLVGETGCGKTTVCQMIAAQKQQDLYTVNCHMHTEGADFLGGLRPVRSHVDDDRLFEWVDGPLILSMRGGGMFLADEISLADDSVLERLNSVLEPEKMLVLAEKGSEEGADASSPEIIYAEEKFRLIGTMNPGGDYGKKELSPALRNRFTEIWCPKVEIGRVSADVISIIEHNVRKGLCLSSEDDSSGFGKAMVQFLEHFTKIELGKKCIISIRDILSWVYFVNKVTNAPSSLDPGLAYVHGACLVLLDGLGSGLTGSIFSGWKQLRDASLNYLCHQVWQKTGQKPDRTTLQESSVIKLQFINGDGRFGLTPFEIRAGPQKDVNIGMFNFEAPRTCINLMRLLRGLQLPRPLLLEGSPGVGKTSLVMALAKASGHSIARINLSEQTDVSDLFGADLPVEGGKGGQFAWHDGPLLQALRHGSWIVLDELNLASQSVLEGLNACFDHRGEIYVPELGRSFRVKHQTTKIFACQNPQHQGGARKGLPKSFLNRFTQVHVEPLSSSDLEFILTTMHSGIPKDIILKMVEYNHVLTKNILVDGSWGHRGGPWELNLRDLFRWCDVMFKHQSSGRYNPGEYVSLIYADRMRTSEDKQNVFAAYDRIFGDAYPSYKSVGRFHVTDTSFQVGHSFLERSLEGNNSEEDSSGDLYMMQHQLPVLESLISCINMNWMSLLVGESGVGKTSVVKLLANLVNKKLVTFTVNSDMDVTELLGGFQQVDFGRELGEAISEAGSCVLASVRELLLKKENRQAEKMLTIWSSLTAAHNSKTVRTTTEELSHFHNQCEILQNLLKAFSPSAPLDAETNLNKKVAVNGIDVDHDTPKKKKKKKKKDAPQQANGLCDEATPPTQVKKLADNLKKLLDRVKVAGGVSGGGTFHWVDSILVKAVRDGDWLLIDGVNVCSASVLDRLNAMLEPGGVLAISERGVVDGAVPCITPHPNFRLFLAMDPQNGEISRAMRNRGLEICPLGSWTTSLDIRSLMQQCGLFSPKLQNALVSAHRAVAEALPVYDQLSISHLKRVASVACHLVEAGYQEEIALTKAAMLVYVRSQGKPDVRETLNTAVADIMKTIKTVPIIPWPQFENQVLSVRGLRSGSCTARIRIAGSLLNTFLLSVMHPEDCPGWSSCVLPVPFTMPSKPTVLVQCLTLLLSSVPAQDWPFLHAWVVRMAQDLPPDGAHLGNLAASALDHIISIAPTELLKTLEKSLTKVHSCDPRHNVQALSTEADCDTQFVESLANKVTLWIWRTLSHFYKQAQLGVEKDKSSCSKVDSMTLLEVSQAVVSGKVSKNASMHKSVPYLSPVLQHLHEVITKLSSNAQIPLSNDEWGCLAAALRWTDRLFEICNQVVDKSVFHLFVPHLALHWQWVMEELLNKMPDSWSELVSNKLKGLVNSLQSIFAKQFGPLDKLAIDIRSCTSPAPFTSPLSSNTHARLVDLASALSPAPNNIKVNVFLASTEGREMCEKLIQLATEVQMLNFETMTQMEDKLHAIERKLQKKCLSKDFSFDAVKAGVLSLFIQTWPIHDYMALMTLLNSNECDAASLHIQDVVSRAPGIYKELVTCLSGPSFRQSSVMGVHGYRALRKCTASHNTQLYLRYSLSASKEDLEEEVSDLKDVYIHPSSCQLTYILLAGSSKISNKSESIIEEVVAGVHVEKLSQLRAVLSTLWSNWYAISNPELTYEASFIKRAVAYLTTAMGSLASAVGVVPAFNMGLYDIATASALASQIADTEHGCLSDVSKAQLQEISKLAKALSDCSVDIEERSAIAAQIILTLGLFQSSFIGRMEPVDPAKRSSLLLQYCEEELQDLESYLTLSGWLDHLRGGFSHASQSLCHPHLPIVNAKCGVLRAEIVQLNKQIAIRPDPPKYHLLLQDIEHFFSTVFVSEKIQVLISGLQLAKKSINILLDVRGKLERMLYSCDSFIDKIVQHYPLYRDLTYPLLQSVTLTCEALLLLSASVSRKNVNRECDVNLGKSLAKYCAFPPCREPTKPLEFLGERVHIAKAAAALLADEDNEGQVKTIHNIIMRATILDLVNVIHTHNYFDSHALKLTTDFFSQVSAIWRQQEEEKAIKVQEEENLYKYKARTIAASETEEEEQEREFKETFPAYYHEFDDLDGPDLLNDPKKEEDETEVADDLSDVSAGYLTDEQLYEVSEWHRIIFTTQVNNSWISAGDNKVKVPSQIVSSAMLRLHILRLIIGKAGPVAENSLDRSMIGAHILSSHTSCAALSQDTSVSILSPIYDIYQDPNPQEALKIRPLLIPVHERVNELLLQWPDHPSLRMINVVIIRVLAFPLTSPLMRHVVGLETVLEKSQEWEKNAHSKVSLMDQLQPVTHQIIEWRKQELQAWRSCLDSVTQKVRTQGRKWWPHLFNMVHAGLAETVSLDEITSTLKRYFETSLLGDFQLRLDLVYAFHCQLAVMDKSKARDKMLALTWNFYHYYLQFLPQVTSNLDKARIPIEKDVKAYVKIARWNDINFFSVRECVIKSQKVLHRHMRNWEKTLRSPISPVLCDTNADLTHDHTGEWDKKPNQDVRSLLSPKLPPAPGDVESFTTMTEKIVLRRLSSFTSRCHGLANKLLRQNPYSSNIDSLEEFVANIISSYQDLQAAATRAENVPEKEPRIQQLRNVMQRRRDSLAHLFKYLSTIGVSYTRGNSLWQDKDVDACFEIKPVDVGVSHKNVPAFKATCEAWPGCVKYLNRCIARHALLLKSLEQAHKDLGPEVMKRLKGITCHLFLFARDQHKSISFLSDHTRELRLVLDDIRNVDLNPPSLSVMLGCWEQLHALNTTLNLHVSETNALLNSVNYSSPLILMQENPDIPDQMQVEEAKCILEDVGKSLPAFVRKYSDYVKYFQDNARLVTPVFVKRLRGAVRKTSEDTEKLKKVIELLSVNEGREFPVTVPLTKWIAEWEVKEVGLSDFVEKHLPEETEPKEEQKECDEDLKVTKNINVLESCLTCVLLAVEYIYKRHETSESEEEESQEAFEKKMVSKGLVENLESDRKNLQLRQVVAGLKKLLKGSENEPSLLRMLKASLPLLEQYQALCESLLMFMVNSNRSLFKCTSVLQAIFQHLALKGFCRPKELEEEEASGEGGKSFEESDGMGLGEGEGKKDMSDRLESEDQLESALREGEKEEPGDQDLQEEEQGVEMDGDFDGKLQDVDKREKDEENESDNEEEEEDHEKQMGETDKGAEQLDKKLWGDEEEEEGEEKEDGEMNEDDGEGDGETMESKMVAKDDNKSKKEKDKEREEKEKMEEMEDTRKENQMAEDGVEYDDNFADPYGGEENDPNKEDEDDNMNLDDEMNLDDREGQEDEEDNGEGDPLDIPEMGVFPEEEREPKDKEEGEEDDDKGEEGEDSDKKEDRVDKNNPDDQAAGEEGEEEGEDVEKDEEGEEKTQDNRQVGTEEVKDDGEEEKEDGESADASDDKESKSKEAEAAEMDTTEGSKDETKEKAKTETGGQREEDKEEEQDEQGQMGEETEEQEGVGESESKTREESHKGESSALVTKESASDQADMDKPRKPGETDEDRTLGDNEKSIQRGLMSKEKHKRENKQKDQKEQAEKEEEGDEPNKNSRFEHISQADDHMDAQVIDAGTQEQAKEAPAPADRQDDDDKMEDEDMLETPMEVDEEELGEADAEKEAVGQAGENENEQGRDEARDPQGEGEAHVETEGDIVLEATVERPPETYFHTLLPEEDEEEDVAEFDENVEGTRRQIEVAKSQNAEEYSASWSQQEARVAPMALQLCEQLRLILEPTQASRLKGDYRTGKRLNMRKVIPYIASEFRKDKIWLRRTQPSKRTYQILVAVDDSESMVDVNAGNLAVESIALVTRALTLLEVGQVGVISFGASTRILHPLDQPFSEAAGSQVLSNLKFDQKVTNFARLLEDSVAMLTCSRQSSSHGNPDTAQLLLILSDGQTHTRSKAVKAAVRAARANRIFIVFLVLDAKDNKYSFYDVLVYSDGKMTNLVESFPFPFFLVVRDLNTLPDALCTALRQWFELVTADAAH